MTIEVIYTDGACTGNGKQCSKGGFGIYIAKSNIWKGKPEYRFNRKGETMNAMVNNVEQSYPSTNIRMEGMAIISTLALYVHYITSGAHLEPLRLLNMIEYDIFSVDSLDDIVFNATNALPEIHIITDSQFWINVIEKWMPSWIKKNILTEKKNPDLLLILDYYLSVLKKAKVKVKFIHVRSHQKGKRSEHANGNDIADVLATSAVHNRTTLFQEIN